MPIQLHSYIQKKFGISTKTKSSIVKGFKDLIKADPRLRVSQHCADAYFLARLAKDVIEGNWRYNLPSKESPLVPWKIINGD